MISLVLPPGRSSNRAVSRLTCPFSGSPSNSKVPMSRSGGNLMVHAVESIFGAICVHVYVSPCTPRLGLKLLQPHLQPSWAQPLDVKFRVCEGLEHEVSGRVEFPCYEGLLFSLLCHNTSLVSYHSFTSSCDASFLSLPRVDCRVCQSAGPRGLSYA